MFETHPFIRPFNGSTAEVKIVKLYEDTNPNDGDVTYAWRIQDIVNSIIASEFTLDHMEEFHSGIGSFDLWWYKTHEEAEADGNAKFDWKQNSWAALPQWIGLSAKKGVTI